MVEMSHWEKNKNALEQYFCNSLAMPPAQL